MRSPTAALLWEIWHRQRGLAMAVAGLTVIGRLLDWSEGPARGQEASALMVLLAMASFVLLFAIFNYTDYDSQRGLGSFPRRLLTLPVSSLRLVALPAASGIVAVELLYLLWRAPLSRGGSTSPLFVALLLGATMVFYQCVLWTLHRLGGLRLIIIGLTVMGVFVVGQLPQFAPTPPPFWRSEAALAIVVASLSVLALVVSWRHVGRLRCGGYGSALQLETLFTSMAAMVSRKRPTFASPAAAQFWFEWRASGLALPLLVGGVLVLMIGPLSWLERDDASASFRLLLGTLVMPVVTAVPMGIAFGKATFWSEEMSMPAFTAVRPLSADDFVAIKVRVALASAAASWLLVVAFLAAWLSLWANLDAISRFAIQVSAFYGQSVAAVYGIAVLVVVSGMLLTWRFLIVRLWSGLWGSGALLIASAIGVPLLTTAAIGSDVDRLPAWLLADPGRVATAAWLVAGMVVLKYCLAAWSWRHVPTKYVWQYLAAWGAATACFAAVAAVLWGAARSYVAQDVFRVQAVMFLAALLVVPVARIGLAPSSLARNRHRA